MSVNNETKQGPLSGMRVIDWTMWQFGPVSTMMLADLGADVIKIESLDGDHGRQFASVAGVVSGLEGSSAYFESLNRNKRGIALDLKHPKGLEVMLKLVDKSDIFVENFRQGVAERLVWATKTSRSVIRISSMPLRRATGRRATTPASPLSR